MKEGLGDSLAGFMADLSPRQVDDFFADPKGPLFYKFARDRNHPRRYDLDRFAKTANLAASPNPARAATISRETHISDLGPAQRSKMLISITYSDGFGRRYSARTKQNRGR